MSIIIVGNVKGGVGKTTLAVNLAIALASGKGDVLLIDGDTKLQTALKFTSLRTTEKGQPGYTAVALNGANIRTQVRQLAPKYAHIVIDVGGEDHSGSLRAALTVADIVLIPVHPRSFELWGADQTAELVTEAREINDGLRAVAVVNEADAQGKDNQAALDVLHDIPGIEVSPIMIGRRKAFPNAAAAGLSVLEHDDPKARDEMRQLVEFLQTTAVRYTNDIGVKSHGNR